jgi:amino acid transporter
LALSSEAGHVPRALLWFLTVAIIGALSLSVVASVLRRSAGENPSLLVIEYGAQGASFILVALLGLSVYRFRAHLPLELYAQHQRRAYVGTVVIGAGYVLMGLFLLTGSRLGSLLWLGVAMVIAGAILLVDLFRRTVLPRPKPQQGAS